MFSHSSIHLPLKLVHIALLLSLLCAPVLSKAQVMTQSPTKQEGLQRVQIIQADFLNGLEIDSIPVQQLLGNVILEHNGIVMTCDSATMFPSGLFEAYGRTVVTSGTTQITGNMMRYDPGTSMAEVRGKIVYLTDGQAVLRTTAVDFNTKEEIGFFEHEGTLKDSTRLLESKQGYYFSKRKEFEFKGRVQSKTTDYTLQSDSMKYNTETKLFDFYSQTHIWAKDSYLYCDKGWYDSDQERMFFLKSSYILSKSQEVFADSIYYEGKPQSGRLYSNIQLIDTSQRTMAMADFATFNMKSKDFEMHKNPSVLMYDAQDTLFVRADLLKSLNLPNPLFYASKHPKELAAVDSLQQKASILTEHDSMQNRLALPVSSDSSKLQASFSTNDSMNILVQASNDSLAVALQPKAPISIAKPDQVLPQKQEIAPPTSDSIQSKLQTQPVVQDTLKLDSTFREIYGIKNVKMFRKDFQAVCDSMYFNTIDSTWKMYQAPILWDGQKMQLSGDSIKAFVKNGTLDHADFLSNAMIVMPENSTDTSKFYNQIKGKNIFAYFQQKTLQNLEVVGNVQSIFFSTPDQAINITEAASMSIRFSDKKVRKVVYRTKVTAENLPLSMTTEEKTKLPGFAWHKERRPKSKEEILAREIRPSNRAEAETLTLPMFLITERIDKIESDMKNELTEEIKK